MGTSQQLQQAYQLIRDGRRQDAAQILVPLVRAEPNNADAWWLLANAVTNPDQQRRALEKVLSIRPGDDKAQKKLSQLTGAPPPPPPSTTAPTVMISTSQLQQPPAAPPPPPTSSDPFGDMSDDPFADMPASTPQSDPFAYPPASSYATPPSTPAVPPPTYTPAPYGTVPPPPMPPPPAKPRRGCMNCCLVLVVVALLLCVGSFIGSALLVNQAVGGLNNLQGVLSGSITPLPNSLVGQAFATLGISNINQAFSTAESAIDQFSGTATAAFGQLGGDLQATANAAATEFSGNLQNPGVQATLTAAAGLIGDSQATMDAIVASNPALAAALGDLTLGGLMPAGFTDRGAINAGQQVSGNLSANSGDRYSFDASSGQTLRITMRQDKDSGLDTLIRVYDPDGRLVAYDDDGLGEGFNSLLEYTTEQGGTFTVVATSFAGGSGAYTLIIET